MALCVDDITHPTPGSVPDCTARYNADPAGTGRDRIGSDSPASTLASLSKCLRHCEHSRPVGSAARLVACRFGRSVAEIPAGSRQARSRLARSPPLGRFLGNSSVSLLTGLRGRRTVWASNATSPASAATLNEALAQRRRVASAEGLRQ